MDAGWDMYGSFRFLRLLLTVINLKYMIKMLHARGVDTEDLQGKKVPVPLKNCQV